MPEQVDPRKIEVANDAAALALVVAKSDVIWLLARPPRTGWLAPVFGGAAPSGARLDGAPPRPMARSGTLRYFERSSLVEEGNYTQNLGPPQPVLRVWSPCLPEVS